MSLHAQPLDPIPELTSRMAHASFPKGTLAMDLRDALGSIYEDADFAHLFPRRGRAAEAPWRLALVTVLQAVENLSDRQAVQMVCGRLDWKYALSLPLDEQGFDPSILVDFRQRSLAHGAQDLLLEPILQVCREHKWLKAGGKQRTDSTFVLAKVRGLSSLESVGESLRAALNELADVEPDWLLTVIRPDPSVARLQQVWNQHFERVEGRIRWRDGPAVESAARVISPYETDARASRKRETEWVGYKVHLTETCGEDDDVHLIVQAQITAATDSNEKQTGGLVDRAGNTWVVFDIDGTREAARQRALPQTEDLPPPFRRLDDVCAAGYTGRKRGEVVRTRTVISQAHSFQWLGSIGNRGNGRYRQELRQGLSAITRYLTAHQLPLERALLRLDGQYDTGAVLSDLAAFAFVTRGKDYTVLDHPLVQARLHLPADQVQQRPESQISRSLYDCPEVPVGPEGGLCRVVVATHPESLKKSPVGVTRAGVFYELFFTKLPQQAFSASDVVELYLHRGAFEPALADEDQEIDPDRWCSHTACGQEVWCLVSQWVWNLRLELGHQVEPTPLRTTEFAPAQAEATEQRPVNCGYGKPTGAAPWKAGRFSGQDFALQPDGTLRCPANQALSAHERRKEADGSLRVVYAASIRSCRPCPLREQCQWNGSATAKPRQVSVLLHPLPVGPAPLRLRAIGAADNTGAPVCSWCDTNASR